MADKLNGFAEGSCTIVKSSGSAPFADVQGEIDTWVLAQRRNLFRKKVHSLYFLLCKDQAALSRAMEAAIDARRRDASRGRRDARQRGC